MDVVVVGHNPGYAFSPERVGRTLLVRPGNRGQYLSVLELTLDADRAIAASDGQTRPLGDAVADHAAVAARVAAFEKDWAARKEAGTPGMGGAGDR